jgi:hypothetical protein
VGGSDRLTEGEFAVNFRVKFSVVSLDCVGSDWMEWGYIIANDILLVDTYASGINYFIQLVSKNPYIVS